MCSFSLVDLLLVKQLTAQRIVVCHEIIEVFILCMKYKVNRKTNENNVYDLFYTLRDQTITLKMCMWFLINVGTGALKVVKRLVVIRNVLIKDMKSHQSVPFEFEWNMCSGLVYSKMSI